MTRVGFIGLGVMGEAMCRNIVRSARYTVNVFDLSQTPVARLAAEGATAMASAAELVEASDTVLLCLPGGAEVEARLYGGENLLIERFQGGQTLVDMSTSPPLLMRRIEAMLVRTSARIRKLDGSDVITTKSTKYFGCVLAAGGCIGSELERRLGLAEADFEVLCRV